METIVRVDQERNVEIHTYYRRDFDWRGESGSGFSFPCDAEGNIPIDDMQPEGIKNAWDCLNGAIDVVDKGVTKYEEEIRLCPCGSLKHREAEYDGRNIFLCYCCEDCRERRLKGYRKDIFENYDTDEPIDPDDWF